MSSAASIWPISASFRCVAVLAELTLARLDRGRQASSRSPADAISKYVGKTTLSSRAVCERYIRVNERSADASFFFSFAVDAVAT